MGLVENARMGLQHLSSKYWGVDNLHTNDDFWRDVMMSLMGSEVTVTMPLEFNTANIERLRAMVECPPGKCGLCCRYSKTSLRHADITRMMVGGVPNLAGLVKGMDTEEPYLDSSKGCPFLVDNKCSIYEHRPEICRLFPLQGGVMATWMGKEMLSCAIRLKCPTSINILRAVMEEQVPLKEWRLMPDLGLLPKYKEERSETGLNIKAQDDDGAAAP